MKPNNTKNITKTYSGRESEQLYISRRDIISRQNFISQLAEWVSALYPNKRDFARLI